MHVIKWELLAPSLMSSLSVHARRSNSLKAIMDARDVNVVAGDWLHSLEMLWILEMSRPSFLFF